MRKACFVSRVFGGIVAKWDRLNAFVKVELIGDNGKVDSVHMVGDISEAFAWANCAHKSDSVRITVGSLWNLDGKKVYTLVRKAG